MLRSLTVAAVLIVGCNRPVIPLNPMAGQWTVTLSLLSDSAYFTPSPFKLTITAVQATYEWQIPDLTLHRASGSTVDVYTASVDSAEFWLTPQGGLYVKLGSRANACTMTLTGNIGVTSGSGSVVVQDGCGPDPGEYGTWQATKPCETYLYCDRPSTAPALSATVISVGFPGSGASPWQTRSHVRSRACGSYCLSSVSA